MDRHRTTQAGRPASFTDADLGRAGQDSAEAADESIDSGAALFTFDADQRIHSWNRAAEELTGIRAEDVLGRACWEVLCGHDVEGGLVCHEGCSFHRMLREQTPVTPATLVIRTSLGTKRVLVPFVTVHERTLFAALMIPAPGSSSGPGATRQGPLPRLTPRQRTVLAMLAEGNQVRSIATNLHLSEVTVRNHIRAILSELGCRSQLAAVAEAHRLRLVDLEPADRAV